MKRYGLLVLVMMLCLAARGAETWAFEPGRDGFSEGALFDLRGLNEPEAGAAGWLKTDAAGDFTLGDGTAVRFWAVNTSVGREDPYRARPQWPGEAPDLAHHARWLAKRGVNMVRLHAHLNPDPETQGLWDVNEAELGWIWRTVGAMKREGVYVTVSPYWAVSMKSDDAKWGTDWEGKHEGLLFFEETLQEAYFAWLRALFTTPTSYLDGKTLAEDPALGIFQIQNESSLLFWTFNNMAPGPRARLGRLFADWTAEKHGSLEKALAAWKVKLAGDDVKAGVLGFPNLWEFTMDAHRQNIGKTARHADTLAFLTETMRDFNARVEAFLRDDLDCPVLVNAGNWKPADVALMNDAERYSYTANAVMAVNRYFGGQHQGEHRGWAIVNGDTYASESVTLDNPLGFPINIKQVRGMPMMVTESAWVFPNTYAAESAPLVAAYGSLSGFDVFYWFATNTDEWTPPRSANGYMSSQGKWICATPDMAGTWPASALAFRKGYIKKGDPAVVEQRPLDSIWRGDTPIITESPSFDPNRDATDIVPGAPVTKGLNPYVYFVGPVEVAYGGKAEDTRVTDVKSYISRLKDGVLVRSSTGELALNTAARWATIDAPAAQGVTGHFPGDGRVFKLRDVTITARNDFASYLLVSLDGKPLGESARVLVQAGTQCRPTGWTTKPATLEVGDARVPGEEITDYGRAPWAVECADATLTVRNPALTEAVTVDMNGMPAGTLRLERTDGAVTLELPRDAMYVVLR